MVEILSNQDEDLMRLWQDSNVFLHPAQFKQLSSW